MIKNKMVDMNPLTTERLRIIESHEALGSRIRCERHRSPFLGTKGFEVLV